MKKHKLLAGLLVCSLVLPGTSADAAKSAKKPKLNKTKLTLKVGGKKQLSIKNKRKWKIKKITYSSSKSKVARVTKKGKVKAIRKGKAVITCKVTLKNKKKYRLKCRVTVKANTKKPAGTAKKPPSPAKSSLPDKTESPAIPSDTGKPQASSNPSDTGKPQEPTNPSDTGKPQEPSNPSDTGKPQDSSNPSDTGKPQASSNPSEPEKSQEPSKTESPTATPIAESRYTLPPAATFTPSPENVSKVSHLSKNGITTMDTGVMRDRVDAYDIIWDMGLGTNLGNTMESCGSWINSSAVQNFETAWGAPVTTQKMLTEIKNAGFSSIRIPVAWSNMMANDGEYTINEAYFNRVETIMNYAFNEDMYVIINIHFDGGWWARFGSQDATERKEAMKKYENMWLQIANRFQEYSDYLIFESANEELGSRLNSTDDYEGSGYFTRQDELFRLTNIINQTFVNIVRSTGGNNARRYLLIAGYDTNIDSVCDGRYQMPKDNIDRHLMVSVHYYSPATYCLVDDPNNSWGYTDTWGSESDVATMKKELGKMRTQFVNKGYPVIIGEYGVSDSTLDGKKVKKKGRDLFFKTVCEYATANNMCPVLWDCSQVFDRKTCTMTDETEQANYLSLSQSIKETPVVKPNLVKGIDRWSGKLAYSGWMPQDADENEAITFLVKNVGSCYAVSGIDWSQLTNPVLKITYSGADCGDTLYCNWYNAADEGPYWTAIYEDNTGFITSETLRKGTEAVIDLSSANLSGSQKLFFTFSGTKDFKGDFSFTVTSGQ